MSTWSTLSFDFTPFESLQPPLKSALKVLRAAEAVLEALMDLVRPFLLDLGNPVRAAISLLLAAVRAIINQLKSGGMAVLLVHPDFSRQDFGSVMESVSGGYRSFESKVFAKFHDASDANRPTYPPGSSAAMLVLYVGAESPADLMRQLYALLSLVKHPAATFRLPAPVELKVRPVFKSDSAAAQTAAVGARVVKTFSGNFSSDLDKKLVLEWRMPSSAAGTASPSFVNHLASLIGSFRFPSFMVERSDTPGGDPVRLRMRSSATADGVLQPKIGTYSMPAADTLVDVRESDGSTFKHFPHKAEASGSSLAEGALTGTYRFVDDDPNLEHGKTYYYRVRAFFGSPTLYESADTGYFFAGSRLVRREGNKYYVDFGSGVVMGAPSSVVKGFVPRQPVSKPGSQASFNPQSDVEDAVTAALLLNFELPAASAGDTPEEVDQKTGWGTLSVAAANVGSLKSVYKDSASIRGKAAFKLAARRVANMAVSGAYDKPQVLDRLAAMWDSGVKETVHRVLSAEFKWALVGVTGGYGPRQAAAVRSYLSKEASYEGQFNFPVDESPSAVDDPSPGTGSLDGPYPLRSMLYRDDPVHVGVDSRQALADFIRVALASRSQSVSYLSWYSVTVGDVFPALTPFTFDLEQFLLSLMKAADSILKEIEAAIQTVLDKIAQLEQILETIISLIEAFDVSVSVSVLAVSGADSSADGLADALLASDGKPGGSPYGLHSGLVFTAGGPGAGSVQAVKALGYILGIPT